MIYAVLIALSLVAFLVILNGYLSGAKKTQIDVVLSLLLIGLIFISFLVAGWKLGLLAIAIAFIVAIISRPIAARLASRLCVVASNSRGEYVGLPPRALQKISKELGKPFAPHKTSEEIFNSVDHKTNAETALLDYCEQQPKIQALFREFNVSHEELQELYHKLISAGAGQWRCGHWVPASALAYPESLRYMLTRREENIQETAFNLIMYFEQGIALET